jgi:hypothetical protein
MMRRVRDVFVAGDVACKAENQVSQVSPNFPTWAVGGYDLTDQQIDRFQGPACVFQTRTETDHKSVSLTVQRGASSTPQRLPACDGGQSVTS